MANPTGPPDHMNSSMYSRRLNPQGSPESEFNNFECFQNYTAPEVFVQGLAGIVNQGDVAVMIRAQKQMLQRFEKTNEMLLNCNALSASRLKMASDDFKRHSKLLSEMKKDLDYVFKKIRVVKAKISVQYPEVYAAVEPSSRQSLAEEAEDDEVLCQQAVSVEAAAVGGGVESVESKAEKSSTANSKRAGKLTEKKKSSSSGSGTKDSIDYVQIAEQSPVDAGLLNVTDDVTHKRRSLGSNRSTSTDNDSSDCTSDTN